MAIKSLADQDHVGGVLTIEADASDGVGVTCVKFFKGSTLIDTDQDTPFTTSFDFNADPPDQHYQIKVTTSDHEGNEKNAMLIINKPKHDFRPPGCTLADNGAFFKVCAPYTQKISSPNSASS
ncbi:hypothetical protein GCM10023156_34160 [Novipirellula rosea]|uniref:Cadherin domain-containing protein n=1 Tax=Novipirellula rosea TaxID=1031540 RepID=A0ABP8MZN4_9BACT